MYQSIRDIQESVPHLEAEIIFLYSQLEAAQDRSDKLLKVYPNQKYPLRNIFELDSYQVSALLYLLKELESSFNIYDCFQNLDLVNIYMFRLAAELIFNSGIGKDFHAGVQAGRS